MELLVRRIHKSAYDTDHSTLRLMPGHVVVACPDGWHWSEYERNGPAWWIIKVTGAPIDAANELLSPQLADVNEPDAILHRRMFLLNLKGLKHWASITMTELRSRKLLTPRKRKGHV